MAEIIGGVIVLISLMAVVGGIIVPFLSEEQERTMHIQNN